VVDENGCSTESTIFVDVNENPEVDLGPDETICAGGGSTTLSSNAVSGLALLWSTGDTTSSITVNSAGSYSLQVTDISGCSGYDTIIVTQVQCVGINELGDKKSFSVFPNPAKSEISIRSEVNSIFQMVDGVGNIVRQYSVDLGTTTFDIESLPAGIYVLRNNQNHTARIIKQ